MCAGWAANGLRDPLGTLLPHQLQSWVPSTLHALMTTPQAAAQIGRFPSKWNCSSPMMTAMPADHCILATGQTRQPQCLGRREGSHGLLLDGLVLVLVSRSSSHIIFSLWLEIRHTQEKTSLRRAGADWSYGRYKPELCIYCKDSWVFSDKPFSALDLCFP